MIIEQRQVGQMAVFAYLVGDEVSGEALVIDPAADTDGIIAAAEKNKVRIKYIVNTHGHVDHIGGNLDIRKATGAGIIIHEDDAEMLVATPATMLRMFGAKPSPPADRTVRDGDLIEVGTIRLQVIHTPGHSREHRPPRGRLPLPATPSSWRPSAGPISPADRGRSCSTPSSGSCAPFRTRRWSCRAITTAARRPPQSVMKKDTTPFYDDRGQGELL